MAYFKTSFHALAVLVTFIAAFAAASSTGRQLHQVQASWTYSGPFVTVSKSLTTAGRKLAQARNRVPMTRTNLLPFVGPSTIITSRNAGSGRTLAQATTTGGITTTTMPAPATPIVANAPTSTIPSGQGVVITGPSISQPVNTAITPGKKKK